jgi:hypothetical protein
MLPQAEVLSSRPVRPTILLCVALLACTPTSVSDAERKGNVSWLEHNGTASAVASLGRLADEDKSAQAALETIARGTENGKTAPGGAAALDVYLAVWAGVERNQTWAIGMMRKALANGARMDDAASAMKRGSPQVAAFVPDLDKALENGCERCAAALASASGPLVVDVIKARLLDAKTRDAMCIGLGSDESSKDARGIFMRVGMGARDAQSCANAAVRMAARDDEVLGWLGGSAEPGLLRAAGESDAMKCDRVARLWSLAISSRAKNDYAALAIPLASAAKRCPTELDATLSTALSAGRDAQTLAVMAIDPNDATPAKLPKSCAAVTYVARGSSPPPTKARAADIAAHCRP